MNYEFGGMLSRRYSLPSNRQISHSHPSRFAGASAVLHVDRSGTIVEKHVPKRFIHQEDIPIAHRYPKYQPSQAKNRNTDTDASHFTRRFSTSLSRKPLQDSDHPAKPHQIRRNVKMDNFDDDQAINFDSKRKSTANTDNNPSSSNNSIRLELNSPKSDEKIHSLIKRTEKARERLNQQKVMLDRYLPFESSNTSVQDEVQFRYGQLVEKMPYLEANYRSSNKENNLKAIEPYEPVDMEQITKRRTGNYTVSNSFTPKISDTRRRARSVLCKIKGDPNYFNYQR